MVNFVEIYNVCARMAIIEAAKRIINFDKVCRSYSDLNFGVTFLEHSVLSKCYVTNLLNHDLTYLTYVASKSQRTASYNV